MHIRKWGDTPCTKRLCWVTPWVAAIRDKISTELWDPDKENLMVSKENLYRYKIGLWVIFRLGLGIFGQIGDFWADWRFLADWFFFLAYWLVFIRFLANCNIFFVKFFTWSRLLRVYKSGLRTSHESNNLGCNIPLLYINAHVSFH